MITSFTIKRSRFPLSGHVQAFILVCFYLVTSSLHAQITQQLILQIGADGQNKILLVYDMRLQICFHWKIDRNLDIYMLLLRNNIISHCFY